MVVGTHFRSGVGAILFVLPLLAQAGGFRTATPTAQEIWHRREIALANWRRQTLPLVSPAQFFRLSTSQQKLVLATYREVAFELETIEPKASARAGAPGSAASLSDLIAFLDESIGDASAQDSGGATTDHTPYACFFGGWPSVLSTNGHSCAQPTAANNPLYKALAAESGCDTESFACFPGIFGKGACFNRNGENGHTFPAGTLAGCSENSRSPDDVLKNVKAHVAVMQAALLATNQVMTKACGAPPTAKPYICNSMRQKLEELKTALKDAPAGPSTVKKDPKPAAAPTTPTTPAQKQLACFQTLQVMHVKDIPAGIEPVPGSSTKPGQCGKFEAKSSTTATPATVPAASNPPFDWCWGVPPTIIAVPAQLPVEETDPANPTVKTKKLRYGTLIRMGEKDYFYPSPTDKQSDLSEFSQQRLDDIKKKLETAKQNPVDKDVATGLIDTYVSADLTYSAASGNPCANPTGDDLNDCKVLLTGCQGDGDPKTKDAASKILAQPPYTPAAGAPVVPVKPNGDPAPQTDPQVDPHAGEADE